MALSLNLIAQEESRSFSATAPEKTASRGAALHIKFHQTLNLKPEKSLEMLLDLQI